MNHTILLLEAQDEIREILGERLNVQGYQVMQAPTIKRSAVTYERYISSPLKIRE